MKLPTSLLSIVVCMLFLYSCRDHQNLEEEYYNTPEQKLWKTFVDKYGTIASTHTWGTLERKSVRLDLNSSDNTKVIDLFVGDPRIEGALRLATFAANSNQREIAIDIPIADSNNIFVCVYKDAGRGLVAPVVFNEQNATIKIETNKEEELQAYTDMQYLLAFEDLGIAVDLDYNDVIVGITYVQGETSARIRPLALGTTLYANLQFDNEDLFEYELHEMFGEYVNTLIDVFASEDRFSLEKRKATKYTETIYPQLTKKVSVEQGCSVMDIAQKLVLKTAAKQNAAEDEVRTISLNKKAGATPFALLIADTNWEWPSEGVEIGKAYPQFVNWVENPQDCSWLKK